MSEIETKDLERYLWQVFWSYSKELGLENDFLRKKHKVSIARKMIPEFSRSAIELDLYFDYPLIHLAMTSIHIEKNILALSEIKEIFTIEG